MIVGILIMGTIQDISSESVNVDSWYFGKGLKPGDSFEYDICDYLLMIPESPDHCYTVTLRVITLLPSPQGDVWILSAHVNHHVRTVDFILQMSASSFKMTTDGSSIPYADSLERTLEWVMVYASSHKPQPLMVGKTWGTILSDTSQEMKLIVIEADSTQLGKETIPTYKVGYSFIKNSFLQISNDFPMPLRAVIHKPITTFKDATLTITFNLLNYYNNVNTCSEHQSLVKIDSHRLTSQQQPESQSVQNLQQKRLILINSTSTTELNKLNSKLQNITANDNKNNRLYLQNNVTEDSTYFASTNNVETEIIDETNFREKLKNSTTAQVLKDLYGPDYEKIIANFDQFLILITNVTNMIKNQFNTTSP